MMTYLLDTNVLVRFLVGDNKPQQEQAAKWFRQAEANDIEIVIDPAVIAETTFVLSSLYKFSRDRIADAMEVLLSQRWLRVREREALLDLWPSYRAGFHFIDSYLIALSKPAGTAVLTFDKKLKNRAR